MPSILTATDLVVRYGERAILDRATLGIQDGDRLGLVGRNGCGKTTFLRILAGWQAPPDALLIGCVSAGAFRRAAQSESAERARRAV